jgi:sugar phosphate isomerase/epimerase
MGFFRRFRKLILHSHLHDNNGVRDEHQVLGRGRIRFLPMFRFLADTPSLLVFEVRPKEGALQCLEFFERRVAPRL